MGTVQNAGRMNVDVEREGPRAIDSKDDPRVRDLIREQSQGMVIDAVERWSGLREMRWLRFVSGPTGRAGRRQASGAAAPPVAGSRSVRPRSAELIPVEFRGRSWILTEDLDRLRSAPPASGVRLLPPRDPYMEMRDRDTIIDPTNRRQVWRALGQPGTVLVDGEITEESVAVV